MRVRVQRSQFDVAAARLRLDVFEAMYGVPSGRRDEPFWVDGRFVETENWREWDHLYVAWSIASGAQIPKPRAVGALPGKAEQ